MQLSRLSKQFVADGGGTREAFARGQSCFNELSSAHTTHGLLA